MLAPTANARAQRYLLVSGTGHRWVAEWLKEAGQVDAHGFADFPDRSNRGVNRVVFLSPGGDRPRCKTYSPSKITFGKARPFHKFLNPR